MESKIVNAGTFIVKENEVSSQMYIIKSGKAKVFKTHMGKIIHLANLGPGEIFGELSFIDAKPRSASVVAATDIELLILDGEEVADKSKALPEWVKIILKNVFYRFRELDQKMAMIQSLGDVKKKPKNEQEFIVFTYKELARYNKLFLMTINELTSQEEHLVEASVLTKEMEQILTDGAFAMRAYFTTLIDHSIIEVGDLNSKSYFTLQKDKFIEFNDYVKQQLQEDLPLMLSRSAIAVLREMSSHITDGQTSFNPKDYQFKEIPLYEESVQELIDKKIITQNGEVFEFNSQKLTVTFNNQSIVKNFDQSSVFK